MVVKCIQSHLNSWNFPFFARISISNFHSAPRLETLVKMQVDNQMIQASEGYLTLSALEFYWIQHEIQINSNQMMQASGCKLDRFPV